MFIILPIVTPKLLTLLTFHALYEQFWIPTEEMLIILPLMTPKLLTLLAFSRTF